MRNFLSVLATPLVLLWIHWVSDVMAISKQRHKNASKTVTQLDDGDVTRHRCASDARAGEYLFCVKK